MNMKIQSLNSQYTSQATTSKKNTDQGLIKDQVILGQDNTDLSIMKKPLTELKSMDGDSVALGAFAGAFAGIPISAIGCMSGAAGPVPLAVASVSIGLVGGLITGFKHGQLSGKEFLKGTALYGGLTAGAGMLGNIAAGGFGSAIALSVVGGAAGTVGLMASKE
jgi:hypothetical protein